MLAHTIMRKWIAAVLLILSASPLTAPFQTCDLVDPGTGGGATSLALTSGASTSANASDPGSLVPPLRTRPGQISAAPEVGLAATSSFDFPPTVITRLIDAPGSPPVAHAPLFPSVLRV